MKTILFLLTLIPGICFADTNVLELTWSQPPGYESTLFTSTNIAGTWQPLSTNPPPYTTVSDKQVAFFYVVVSPTNPAPVRYQFSGSGIPSMSAPSGSTFVETNIPAFWFKTSDNSNVGWIQGI